MNSSGNLIVQNHRGVKTVQIKLNKKTQHLTALINKQKSKPPKKNPVSIPFFFFVFWYLTKFNYLIATYLCCFITFVLM